MKSLLVAAIVAVISIQYVNAKKTKAEIYAEVKERFKNAKDANELPKIRGNMLMKINKRGGKMLLVRQGKLLEVRVKAITERFANDTVKEDIVLKELQCTANKDNDDDNQYNLKAISLGLECSFPNMGNANATLEYFMFKEGGNVTGEDGNEYEVKEGSVKINLKINNWPNAAAALDVVFGMKCGLGVLAGKIPKKLKDKIIKKAENAPQNRRRAEAFSVCPEARGVFAANYKDENGVDNNMVEGYPKAGDGLKDSEAEITLRFAGDNVIYDPVMEVGEDVLEEQGGASSAVSFIPNFLLMVAAFIVGQMKFF